MTASLEALLAADSRWSGLVEKMKQGGAVGLPPLWFRLSREKHFDMALRYAHLALCEEGRNCGVCRSCRSWDGLSHVDWLLLGEPEKPADVLDCRTLSAELSLSPVVAPLRLMNIWAADQLNVASANSLLKITEEPPERGRLVFFSESYELLATLRSRVWVLSFYEGMQIDAVTPPDNELQWQKWMADGEKRKNDDWKILADQYSSALTLQGHHDKAAALAEIAAVAAKGHLSSAQWADLLFLVLREEYGFEHLFGDLRQTSIFRASRR